MVKLPGKAVGETAGGILLYGFDIPQDLSSSVDVFVGWTAAQDIQISF